MYNKSPQLLLSFSIILLILLAPNIFAQNEEKAEVNLVDSVMNLVQDSLIAEATPLPPINIIAIDKPNDKGGAIIIKWDLSASDNGGQGIVKYVVYRSSSETGSFEEIGDVVRGGTSYTDNKAEIGSKYFYKVSSINTYVDPSGAKLELSSSSIAFGPVISSGQWFNTDRFWCLIFVLIISGSIMFFIQRAKSGGELYVRKIAGIDAVEEAVGRATEMGRKIFFIPGIQDMNDVQTIAGIAILGRVAQISAQYETWLEVPVSKSMVMVTARETMKEAYAKVGRPDAYNEAQVHYLTDDQFGYAAAIDGMVVREKPAAIFYMGAFFAESLILAETGNAAGAIQIAGTAMPSQLPFFVASCDYTLIGEELFAASAYLSKEPRQLGSLKGQDVGKAIFIVAIILGIIFETAGIWDLSQIFNVK